LDATFLVAFISMHVFAYGGATAFNSYYDRDEGPIGMLAEPPPVTPGLLPFSLAVMAIGWALAWTVNPPFFWLYGAMCALAMAYSHPAIRLKARPLPSVLTVAIGQGAGATLAGWLAATGHPASAFGPIGLLGILGATLLTTGLFPLTQIYQIEEDRQRGDDTFVVHWGPQTAFRFSQAAWLLSLPPLALVVGQVFSWAEAAVIVVFVITVVIGISRWAQSFRPEAIMANFRRTMRLSALASGGFWVYLVARLLLSLYNLPAKY
jgi:1,4-dihydroxy-2-naphthoate octaprenyltransferase